MEHFRLVKGYREDSALRASFCALAENTFGIDFESWYQNSYWTDKYNPYSIVHGDLIVANVSVNAANYLVNGKLRKFIQLGTVMTDEAYRNRGLIRALMKEIDRDYAGIDGVFLFANDEVLDFYPKFGFRKAEEIEFMKTVDNTGKRTVKKIPMKSRDDWDRIQRCMKAAAPYSVFELTDNSELFMFYLTSYMVDTVWYDPEQNACAVAEIDGGELTLHGVFSEQPCDLDRLIAAFGKEVGTVKLAFTPLHSDGFDMRPYREEDCTLFVKGNGFDDFAALQVKFPALGYA